MKRSLSIAVMMLLQDSSANLTLKHQTSNAPVAPSAFSQVQAKEDAAVLAQADQEAEELGEAEANEKDDKEDAKEDGKDDDGSSDSDDGDDE